MLNNTKILVGFAVVGAIALFLNNFGFFTLESSFKATYISPNEIRGSAVIYKGIPYTLNFEQQNTLVRYLNQSRPTIPTAPARQRSEIQEIVIYRFGNNPEIHIVPIAYVDGSLVFSAPEWNADGYLADNSSGKLKDLLSQTYDH